MKKETDLKNSGNYKVQFSEKNEVIEFSLKDEPNKISKNDSKYEKTNLEKENKDPDDKSYQKRRRLIRQDAKPINWTEKHETKLTNTRVKLRRQNAKAIDWSQNAESEISPASKERLKELGKEYAKLIKESCKESFDIGR
jgi:hypothetical protein